MRILFLSFLFIAITTQANASKIAIIIDDIGYRQSDEHVLSLPAEVTYSILPHTPFGRSLAKQGYYLSHDIMLHIPMEAENGKLLGPGALTSTMNETAVRNTLHSALNDVPYAIGINNHMGSKLTKMHQPMLWTMRYLKERQLFFVDSVTTKKSKALSIAKNVGVPSLSRQVFLDNTLTYAYIQQQFQILIEQAKLHKTAIGIAHPHPETIKALQKLLPTLASKNITLVPISTLFTNENILHKAQGYSEE